MTRKSGILGSVAAAALALAAFTGAALAAGGGNGNAPVAPGKSAAAPGQVKKDAVPQPAKPAHGNASAHSSGSTSQPGVKPSSATAKGTKPTHTTVGANPDVSKRYGNGKTAAQIAKSRGAPDSTELYGPGNSQPHKVRVCPKDHWVDVHSVKSYDTSACATQQPSAQVTQAAVCGAVTTTATATKLQRGHAYGRLKHGKSLHSKIVTQTVTLPTGEVCTVSGPTQQIVQQQVAQLEAQAKSQESTPAGKTGRGGVLGATFSQKAAPKHGRGGVLGAFASVGHRAVRGTLPFTGFPIWAAVVIGAALLAGGLMLARRRGLRATL